MLLMGAGPRRAPTAAAVGSSAPAVHIPGPTRCVYVYVSYEPEGPDTVQDYPCGGDLPEKLLKFGLVVLRP